MAMYDATVRDAAVRERLAQSLSNYYYRRTLGVVCFDPRRPAVREEYDAIYRRKFALARHTLNKLLAARDAKLERESGALARGANIIPWHRRAAAGYEVPAVAGRWRSATRAQTLASSTSSMATGLPL